MTQFYLRGDLLTGAEFTSVPMMPEASDKAGATCATANDPFEIASTSPLSALAKRRVSS